MTEDRDYLHEAEDVWFLSTERLSCKALWGTLRANGFRLYEDVFSIDRKGRIPIWQSRSLASVYIFLASDEVYERGGSWDRLRVRYLLATLPVECINVFVDAVATLAGHLGMPMQYRGRPVGPEELRSELLRCASEIRQKVGEPGSRDVRAYIELTYPRD